GDWAIIARFSLPAANRFVRQEPSPFGTKVVIWRTNRLAAGSENRFVRQITTFVPDGDGSWRRDDETHHNVLIDTARVPRLLAAEGVDVRVASAFGTEQLPAGLRVLIGRRAA